MANYSDVMTAIVQKQITIIGSEKALRYARKVPGVAIAENGQISSGASPDTLALLVAEYKKLAGAVAVMLMRNTVAPLIKGSPLVVPQELR